MKTIAGKIKSYKQSIQDLDQNIPVRAIFTFSLILVFSATQMGCFPKQMSDNTGSEQLPLVVYLVRHGEKVDQSKDPELSAPGKHRAEELANVLRSAKIEYVHSSDFIRTRETAQPTANKFGLTTEIYNPRDLEALVRKMRDIGGIHLVVGHSNTTPKMAALLGGDPVSNINEADEFDRLYIIMSDGNGNTNSTLMRYGNLYLE